MLHGTLNLGILAHVDAGKTTLTEQLLYAAGVIDEIGSVDHGTTQTDSLALERQRGITIKSAVVSFALADATVNLIDTPGHPDFIAEVERVLSVLDGAVLVISAVEGVQAQTRLLMRALQRLRVPTLIFVNKIDRPGAGDERVLQAISERLTPAIIPIGSASDLGTRAAGFTPSGAADADFGARLASAVADRDDAILAAYVNDETSVPYRRLREELAAQTKQALLHPVFFGSALTGAGVESLIGGIAELLPAAEGDCDADASGTVFKVERGKAGEKIAYVRMFSGTVRVRERLRFGQDVERKVTAIDVFDRGSAVQRESVCAGQIGKLWGLGEIQIGDTIGRSRTGATDHHFAPPTLETVVVPSTPDDKARLRVALAQLAEQDPLINVRQDDIRQEISVSLYGEVQKEVIQATLADDFDVDVGFRETTTICIERPVGTGSAVETMHEPSNPFLAGDRAPRRACGARRRRPVSPGGRARGDAVLVLQGGRGDRSGDAAARHLRLGRARLRCLDDALRLRTAAEPRPSRLRQEHVEHRERLPQPDAARPDERARAGGNHGVRAHRPVRPRCAGGIARSRPACAGAVACSPANADHSWSVEHGRGARSGGSRAQAAAAATGPHAWRRGAGVRLRPLSAGQRGDPEAAAVRQQPAQP